MVDQSVNRDRCGHRILKDFFPLREWQIASNYHTTSFISIGQEGKEHLQFITTLLNITNIIDDDWLNFNLSISMHLLL